MINIIIKKAFLKLIKMIYIIKINLQFQIKKM